eukprot:8209629-Pyramimonas_sp.AAC.1
MSFSPCPPGGDPQITQRPSVGASDSSPHQRRHAYPSPTSPNNNNNICFTGINRKIVSTYEPKMKLTNSPK